MGVRAQPKPGNVIEGQAIQLIERSLAVASRTAAPQIGVRENVLDDLHASSSTESLEKIFVEQPGADQSWVECRDVAKVIVIEVQFDSRRHLHPDGEEVAAQARAG